MDVSKLIAAAVVGAIALFLFDGAWQALPGIGVRAVERLETAELTTGRFAELSGRMAYIATDETVSFVATQPASYYDLARFFAFEFVTALLIAGLFAVLFARLGRTPLGDRLRLTFVFALIASLAIHIPYLNWWGFSVAYTVGVVSKTILGWLLVAFLQNRFVYKIK